MSWQNPFIQEKIEKHRQFWEGKGSCLILIPPKEQKLKYPDDVYYELKNYPFRFKNPEAMWESEIMRAKPVIEWPTDGIPTVRPNLGVIFIPAIAGLESELREGQMPWVKGNLEPEEIRNIPKVKITDSDIMKRAEEFYKLHQSSSYDKIIPYHADTQGVFDLAHLIYGNDIFYDIINENKKEWIKEFLNICCELYINVSIHLKDILNEESKTMIHGHGTSQGVYFPHAGVRMSEDSPTMISPEHIKKFIIPMIEKAAEPFGGVFVHYCGNHKFLFETLCQMDCVRAIDLGNPEMYDTRWILEKCGESETVLYSRINSKSEETWKQYLNRIAKLIRETDARCILRPLIFPERREACQEMIEMWHKLTT